MSSGYKNLAAAQAATGLIDQRLYYLIGNTTRGDAGAGWYVFDAESTDAADADTIVVTSGGRLIRASSSNLATQLADALAASQAGPAATSVAGLLSAISADVGSAAFTAARVAVATTSGQIVAARSNRVAVTIMNPVDAVGSVAVGPSVATLANNYNLVPGQSITLPTTAAVYAIAAVAGSVDVLETY